MNHDGSGVNAGCPDRVKLMSSSRPSGSGAFTWSTCSRGEFEAFLK